MMASKIKVVIVDDHTMFRDGVASMLRETNHIDIVGSVSSGSEALSLLENVEAEIVITDLAMEEMDGLTLTTTINQKYPELKVLVLTMHSDSQNIKKLLEAGASGYLLKNAGIQEFLKAINVINDSGKYFSEKVKDVVLNSLMKKKEPESKKAIRLTKRELEVLDLIAREFTNVQVSDKLFISLHTVETHRRNIMKKLDVHNGVGLLRQAIQLGLIDQ